jgi:peroxiredoxin
LGGFADRYDELAALGVMIIAASVDGEDKAKEIADELPFPVAFGLTRAEADELGSWWEERRGIVQPSEFIVDDAGTILHASYSSGPLARTSADDVIRFAGPLQPSTR